jgi:flagellar hook protein FlgE
MGLTGALFSGVSGINTNGNAMNILGDNIANINTVGFKSTRAVFFDLLSAEVSGVKVGTGSRLAAGNRLFAQGGLETTNSPTDMSVQGKGFFILKDADGRKFYSRAGQFNVNKDGTLVNAQGLKVQGLNLDINGNPTSGLADIVLGSNLVAPPIVTSTVSMAANLSATATTPATALPADAVATQDTPTNWFSASNFSTVVTIIDSLGQAHDLTFLFRKTATANQWDYRVVANAGEVSGGTAGQLTQVSAAGGKLVFNSNGTLNPTASTITSLDSTTTTATTGIVWNNGASTQIISSSGVGFTGTTQYDRPASVSTLSQNGVPPGGLTGISISTEGIITGLFSSGFTQPLNQIALADFTNPEGLSHVGNSLFAETPASGEVVSGNPEAGGFGSVLSGSLELSNVDLAAEFVKMVTTQRGFQASSRTITVTDSLLEEVANLKR